MFVKIRSVRVYSTIVPCFRKMPVQISVFYGGMFVSGVDRGGTGVAQKPFSQKG
jgi:hypothetical protein